MNITRKHSKWDEKKLRPSFGSRIGKAMRKTILILGAAVLGSSQALALDVGRQVTVFSKSLTYATISYDNEEKRDRGAFFKFHRFLEDSFPRVHAKLKRETVNELSLLYRWPGRNTALDPILITAHIDSVPAEDDRGEWKYKPFSGHIDGDGKIWSRGAFDDKIGLLASIQAVENLLERGIEPERTIYLAYGHDEEVGGHYGAEKIAALLRERGIKFASVLDEGGAFLSDGIVMGIKPPIGVIAVTEKGSVNIRLRVRFDGVSHSMAPPAETPVGILAHAIAAMEDHPFSIRIVPSVGRFLDAITDYMPWSSAFAVKNRWLLSSLVEGSLAKQPTTNAMIRTVFSPNILQGSEKANAIPDVATAIFNVRILPGDTPDTVVEFFKSTIDDERVAVDVYTHGDRPRSPRPTTETPSAAYDAIVQAARQVFPEVKTYTPWMAPGGTDSRHYTVVSSQVLGFRPFVLDSENKKGPHGTGEYITVSDYNRAVAFFETYIRLSEEAGEKLKYSPWKSRQ